MLLRTLPMSDTSPKKEQKTTFSFNSAYCRANRAQPFYLIFKHFFKKNLVAQSNMFPTIIQYNAQKLVWIVIQVNTEILRIKGNMH